MSSIGLGIGIDYIAQTSEFQDPVCEKDAKP
ncbi:uncharacterized protein G2W53_020348 [Senna tora]|uniref:Uncharacterized protein n=1 Tax=Senna tora TaxID=362788 RepID=A0A834U333_9FABA|nr:uncharacterized protein G2W53_020348 [Senna tora]